MSKPEQCKGCPLEELGQGPVYPSVPLDREPEYIVVGEAPGADEVKLGAPFVGASGRMLRALLARSRINDRTCAFANTVWCRPPANATPSKDVVAFCTSRWLDPWLEQHAKGKKLLIVGSIASEHLLGLKVTDCAGYPVEGVAGSKLAVATFHPAAVLRDKHLEPITQRHVTKLQVLDHAVDFSGLIRLHPTYGELAQFVQEALAGGEVCFDFETRGLELEHRTPICIAMTKADGVTVGVTWDERVKELLRPLFASPGVKLIGYNIKFDAHVADLVYGKPPAGQWIDVMRLAQLADLETYGMSLKAVVPAVLDVPLWKDKVQEEGVFLYNAKDALYTWMVYKELTRRMQRTSAWKLWERTRELERVTYAMERRGFCIDLERMAAIRDRLKHELELLEHRWKELAPGVNPNSPVAVQKWLAENGFRFWHDSKGKETTEAMYLKLAASHSPRFKEPVELLLSIRKARKFLSTYLDYLPGLDGRLHANINVCGTVTGRPSFSNPNLGNIPKDDEWGIRSFFVAAPGHVLVSADWSQAEARVIAMLAGDELMVRAFAEQRDVHKLVASRIYGVREDEVTKEQRTLAKRILYGISYGAGPRKISENAGIRMKDAKALLERFATEFPKYWGKLESWSDQADNLGYLKNPFGRTKSFCSERTATQSRNWIPQSTVADMMNIVLCELAPRVEELGGGLVLQIYDQVIAEVPEYRARECASLVREHMSRYWEELGGSIPADVSIGKRWSDL